jgi:hypothetical protein
VFHGGSAIERLNEATNAIKTLKEIPLSFLTGLGHGTVYFPYLEIGSISRNFTEEGYTHNIHIGPVMLFFRYGIFGLALYIVFVFIKGFFFGRKIYNSIRDFDFKKTKDMYFPTRLFYINYFIYSILFITFHFANVLQIPFLLYL